MNTLKYIAIGLFIMVVTYGIGEVHGKISNRYGLRPDVELAGKRLERMPTEFGDWKLEKDEPLAQQTKQILQCSGSISHVYRNSKTGESVSISVIMGPSGPISVHTPEVCYSSREFKVTNARKKWRLPQYDENGNVKPTASPDVPVEEFWDLRLQSNKVSASSFRVLYAWTNTQDWIAAESPRFSYAGSPYLYKLQLAGPIPLDDNQRDACAEFLTVFLPVLRTYILDSK